MLELDAWWTCIPIVLSGVAASSWLLARSCRGLARSARDLRGWPVRSLSPHRDALLTDRAFSLYGASMAVSGLVFFASLGNLFHLTTRFDAPSATSRVLDSRPRPRAPARTRVDGYEPALLGRQERARLVARNLGASS